MAIVTLIGKEERVDRPRPVSRSGSHRTHDTPLDRHEHTRDTDGQIADAPHGTPHTLTLQDEIVSPDKKMRGASRRLAALQEGRTMHNATDPRACISVQIGVCLPCSAARCDSDSLPRRSTQTGCEYLTPSSCLLQRHRPLLPFTSVVPITSPAHTALPPSPVAPPRGLGCAVGGRAHGSTTAPRRRARACARAAHAALAPRAPSVWI
jgi:hypothetical protein